MSRCRLLCLFVWISARFWIHQPRMDEIAAGEVPRDSDQSMLADFVHIRADLDRIEPELTRSHRGEVA